MLKAKLFYPLTVDIFEALQKVEALFASSILAFAGQKHSYMVLEMLFETSIVLPLANNHLCGNYVCQC